MNICFEGKIKKVAACVGLLSWVLISASTAEAQQLNRSALENLARRQTRIWQQTQRKFQKTPKGTPGNKMVMPRNGRLPLAFEQSALKAAQGVGNQQVWTGGVAGLSLSGNGYTIGYWDLDRPRLTHQEYTGRAAYTDTASSAGIDSHATKNTGIIIASGMNAQAKGMAFEASLNAYNFTNDTGEMAHAAANGLKISGHPYEITAGWKYNYLNDDRWTWFSDTTANANKAYQFGFYDVRAAQWDSIMYNAPQYLIVKAAGNQRGRGPTNQPVTHNIPVIKPSGITYKLSHKVRPLNGGTTGYETLTSASVAKNVLVVGGVKSTSSDFSDSSSITLLDQSGFGPTDDGRIKPDLVAPGEGLYTTGSGSDSDYSSTGGTSAASSVIAGSAALLQQHYQNLAGKAISSATLKALMIHTANDFGPVGPDYKFGWGLLNTERAARFLSAWHSQDGAELLKELTLNDGQTKQFTYQAAGDEPLKITLGWTDPAGDVPSTLDDPTQKILVNDLDVRLTGPGGTVYMPWKLDAGQRSAPAGHGDNQRDNVEQIVVSNPAAGTHTIRISHKGSLKNGSQKLSLLAGPAEPKVEFHTIADGNWSQASNWQNGQIPATSFQRAVIENDITLDIDATIGGIAFNQSGAALNLGSRHLTLYGSVKNGNGAVGFEGTGSSILDLKEGRSYSDPIKFKMEKADLGTLIVDLPASDEIRLGSPVKIHTLLKLKSGVLNTRQAHPVLVSNSTNAAALDAGSGAVKGPLGYARLYHVQGSGWRLLSTAFQDVVFSSLQDSFHTQGGRWAEHVIGEPQSSSDPTSNLVFFDEDSQSYQPYYGADSTFTPGQGYLFYMYKDALDGTSILPASWAISGDEPSNFSIALHRGASNSDSYNLVGNPYAGVLDWHALVNASSGLGSSYALWDPSETSGGGTAGFKYYNMADGVGAAGRYIAPMQGFFVTATASGASADFNKNEKITGKNPDIFGKEPASGISSHIQLQLYDSHLKLKAGEIYMVFDNQASKKQDASDVLRLQSLSGSSCTLSFVGPRGHALAFEGRSKKGGRDVFELKPEITTSGQYTIKWPVWYNIPSNWKVILHDGLTGTDVNMRAQNSYQFKIRHQNKKSAQPEKRTLPHTAITAQKDKARFRIEVTKDETPSKKKPGTYKLEQNYPNPFQSTTSIPYQIPEGGHVRIRLFNVLGQQVRTVVDEEKTAGFYEAPLNSSGLASGVYFYRITAADFKETQALTLIK